MHANEPHEFRPVRDAGLGTGFAGISPSDASSPAQLVMTSRYLRASGCAVPGCGKDRNDPIHAPAE